MSYVGSGQNIGPFLRVSVMPYVGSGQNIEHFL